MIVNFVGDIFESPRKFECISSELGRRVVLTTVVCSCARASFRYVWNCNGQDLPFVNDFITEFEMSSASEGTYLCLAYDWNSNQPVYSSQPFIVKAKEAEGVYAHMCLCESHSRNFLMVHEI